MEYVSTNPEQLGHLQLGLDILSHIHEDLVPGSLYLFGLLKPDSTVLAEVNDAVWEDLYAGEEHSNNINVTTAAIAIRLSGSVLNALLGSGLTVRDSEFCFILNDEVKTSSFSYSNRQPRVTISEFSHVALSHDSYPLTNFMRTEGIAQDKTNPGVINRTEQAIGDHGGAASPKQHTHVSALNVKEVADFLANWSHRR
jgi:hypothetical protein